MESILITGASGFVGKQLSLYFLDKGYHVIGVGTSTNHPYQDKYPEFQWISTDTTKPGEWQKQVANSEVIVNLAGRSIFRYWTRKYKQQMYDSRILTTRNIVQAMEKGKNKTFLTTSAVGIYGDREDDLLDENSKPGDGFLATICKDWEKEANNATSLGVRVVVMRFGVVLGKGGALSSMLPAYKMFVGGPLGDGHQWFPWIHMEDILNAVDFIIQEASIKGIFNFTAPTLVRQKQFAKSLGKVLHRPSFFPSPGFIIKLIMGQMGAALLESQRAVPKNLLEAGFEYKYPNLNQALETIFI